MLRLLHTSPHVRAAAGYGLLALVFTWPLPVHLGTHLLGGPQGDTGVYVWNLWVFSHEVLEDGHLPFFTSAIFSLDPLANLSLHNYTVFADLLAVPLLPLVGTVAAFNLLYLLMVTLNGYVMFLLARETGAGNREAWLAGVLFAFAPCLVARSSAHFSLVMAAPIVAFMLVVRRMERRPQVAKAAIAGAIVAWAAFCDPYYGVYCLALAGWHVAWRNVTVRFAPRMGARSRAERVLNLAIALVLVLVAWIALTGGGSARVFGRVVAVKTLYTPMLVLTVLALVRLGLDLRPRIGLRKVVERWRPYRLAAYGALSCALLMSPFLYALGARIAEGRYVAPKVFWRTSTPGVDLLAFVLPNPNHPLFRVLSEDWLGRQAGGFAGNVASLPLAAVLLIAGAVRWAGFRPPRYWTALGLLAAALAAGPFFHVAGLQTCIPTPWAILRYVPLIGDARAPARFMAIVMIAVSVLFALALKAVGDRFPAHRTRVIGLVAAVLLFEVLPAPRPLYSAEVPGIYHQIASDPREVRVLELPFGVRDGLSSVGDFSAASQYYQTFHHKRLIGGYLSRVSQQRVAEIRRRPILRALIDLSEGREVSAEARRSLRLVAPSFVRASRLGYVVVDRSRASPSLAAFAIETLDLEKIGVSGGRELYRPRPAW
jgi:hypothetical protein